MKTQKYLLTFMLCVDQMAFAQQSPRIPASSYTVDTPGKLDSVKGLGVILSEGAQLDSEKAEANKRLAERNEKELARLSAEIRKRNEDRINNPEEYQKKIDAEIARYLACGLNAGRDVDDGISDITVIAEAVKIQCSPHLENMVAISGTTKVAEWGRELAPALVNVLLRRRVLLIKGAAPKQKKQTVDRSM